MKHERARLRRLRVWATHPIAVVVIAAALAADFLAAPGWSSGHPTPVGLLADAVRLDAGGRINPSPVHIRVYLVREGEGWRVIDPNRESWDELTRLILQSEVDAAQATYGRPTGRYGLWRHSVEVRREHITLFPLRNDMSVENLGGARDAFVDHTAGSPHYQDIVSDVERIRREDSTTRRILWPGLAHDILAFLLLGLLAVGVRRLPDHLRHALRARRRRRGLCPHCRYDLRGLEGEVCPECGRTL